MASDPHQQIQDAAKTAGKKAFGASSQALGTGAKYLVRSLTGGASTAVDSFIPWKWIGAIITVILLGFLAMIAMIIFMFAGNSSSSSSSSTTASSTTGGGSFSAGPITCGMIPSQMITWAKSAQSAYHTPWALTLAIAKNETDFGTYSPPLLISPSGIARFDLSSPAMISTNPQDEVSSTGAVGVTQFLPSTWSGSNAPGISGFGTGVPYSTVLSGVRFQTNPAVIQQFGGYGDAYWLANGKPSGMIANPFSPQQAIYATADYLDHNYQSSGSWSSAVNQYAGGTAGYVSEALSNEQQISKCGG